MCVLSRMCAETSVSRLLHTRPGDGKNPHLSSWRVSSHGLRRKQSRCVRNSRARWSQGPVRTSSVPPACLQHCGGAASTLSAGSGLSPRVPPSVCLSASHSACGPQGAGEALAEEMAVAALRMQPGALRRPKSLPPLHLSRLFSRTQLVDIGDVSNKIPDVLCLPSRKAGRAQR